jgi:predicted dienelactone hydrolase
MRRLLVVLLTFACLSAACGDDGDTADGAATSTTLDVTTTADATTTAPTTTEGTSTSTTASSTTTEAPPTVTAADLATVGPYPVGVTTVTLPSGALAEIWYPAGPEAEGASETYAVRTFTPQLMRDLVPEEIDDTVTVAAGRDAAVADDGPFPLVLFSHGSTSFRLQSSNLTHHLASWGMVVASPDHASRNLVNLLEPAADPPASVDDMLATLDVVLTDAEVGPAVDPDRIGVSGHSAGGGTTLATVAALDVAGYVSYASGSYDGAALPDVPSMFMAGSGDTVVEPARTRAAFDSAPAPSWYLEFADSGHLAFSDLCAVGDGDATLIGLAEAAGLGEFLDDGIRRLGTDGCEDPNRPVTEVWPGVHQATTGFFRWVFGIDDEPIGVLAPAVEGVTAADK